MMLYFRSPLYFNAEIFWRRAIVALVEGDNGVGLAVDRRFQNHFIRRIAQTWTPQEMGFDGFGQSR